MAHQLQIASCGALRAAEGIGIERLCCNSNACFTGQLLHQARVFHVFQEDGANTLPAHLLDDARHRFGRCRTVGACSLRRNECDLVARAQVSKRIVCGQYLALGHRDGGKLLLRPVV